jgi:hypothetical protein
MKNCSSFCNNNVYVECCLNLPDCDGVVLVTGDDGDTLVLVLTLALVLVLKVVLVVVLLVVLVLFW